MSDGTVFDLVAARLTELSGLDELAGRGTIRLVLKEAGLDARSVTREQMETVIDRLLAPALESRGVERAEDVCVKLRGSLSGIASQASADSPEAVFARLGG